MYRILSFLFMVMLGYSSIIYALPSDEKEKVFVVADSGVYNYKSGINVFEGNVKVDQGTTHLLADRLVTKNNEKHKIKEAIAYGIQQQAHYWTLPKPDDSEMHAYANVIKFYPIESLAVLQDDASVIQGENVSRGQLILYNRKDQTITVPATQNARAVLVYNPDK